MTIRCDNVEEYEKLASMLSAKGYRWASGENPMKWNPYSYERSNTKCYINLYSNHIIRYDDNDNYMDAISVETYRIKEGIKMDKFTKADLKDGMVVKVRSGRFYMYFQKWGRLVRDDGHLDIKDYNEDLTFKRTTTTLGANGAERMFDIVQVYELDDIYSFKFSESSCTMNLIWERPEEVVMTISEIEEKLGIKNLKVVSEKEKDNG